MRIKRHREDTIFTFKRSTTSCLVLRTGKYFCDDELIQNEKIKIKEIFKMKRSRFRLNSVINSFTITDEILPSLLTSYLASEFRSCDSPFATDE